MKTMARKQGALVAITSFGKTPKKKTNWIMDNPNSKLIIPVQLYAENQEYFDNKEAEVELIAHTPSQMDRTKKDKRIKWVSLVSAVFSPEELASQVDSHVKQDRQVIVTVDEHYEDYIKAIV